MGAGESRVPTYRELVVGRRPTLFELGTGAVGAALAFNAVLSRDPTSALVAAGAFGVATANRFSGAAIIQGQLKGLERDRQYRERVRKLLPPISTDPAVLSGALLRLQQDAERNQILNESHDAAVCLRDCIARSNRQYEQRQRLDPYTERDAILFGIEKYLMSELQLPPGVSISDTCAARRHQVISGVLDSYFPIDSNTEGDEPLVWGDFVSVVANDPTLKGELNDLRPSLHDPIQFA